MPLGQSCLRAPNMISSQVGTDARRPRDLRGRGGAGFGTGGAGVSGLASFGASFCASLAPSLAPSPVRCVFRASPGRGAGAAAGAWAAGACGAG